MPSALFHTLLTASAHQEPAGPEKRSQNQQTPAAGHSAAPPGLLDYAVQPGCLRVLAVGCRAACSLSQSLKQQTLRRGMPHAMDLAVHTTQFESVLWGRWLQRGHKVGESGVFGLLPLSLPSWLYSPPPSLPFAYPLSFPSCCMQATSHSWGVRR